MQCGVYKHYKGGYYQVIGIGQHTETKEILVIYISLTGAQLAGPRIRCRPKDGPDGFNMPGKFQYIGDSIA